MAIKYKRTPIDEERALHEAYQILLRELEFRRMRSEKMSSLSDVTRQRLLSDEGSATVTGLEPTTTSSKSSKKSGKKSKSAKAGRRSPSPNGAEAKRRASMALDDDDDDHEIVAY